jgi:hypothetical protein
MGEFESCQFAIGMQLQVCDILASLGPWHLKLSKTQTDTFFRVWYLKIGERLQWVGCGVGGYCNALFKSLRWGPVCKSQGMKGVVIAK